MSDWLPPPRTGEFTLQTLRAYRNPWITAVVQRLMGPPFSYRSDDRMTGELLTELVQYVDSRNGRTNASRIRPGSSIEPLAGFQQATGIILVTTRDLETSSRGPFTVGLAGGRYRRHARPYPTLGTSSGRVLSVTHTVEPGETLSRLAERYYGDGRQWRRIFEANRGRVRNPNVIRSGQDLLILDPNPALVPLTPR